MSQKVNPAEINGESRLKNVDFWHLKMITIIDNSEQRSAFIHPLHQVK